jgi:hypothetical protein
MATLSPEMPSSDKVLYVFNDFETTQNKKVRESATVHVPNLVCAQQFCTLCEEESNIDQDCERCGKRKHLARSRRRPVELSVRASSLG